MTNLNLRRMACALTVLLSVVLSMTSCASFDAQNGGNKEEMAFDDQPKTTPSVATEGDPMSNETSLTDLRYVSRKGGGTVVIESSQPVVFRTRENRESNQYIVDIANARLPDRLKRPYITKDFNQAIASLNAYQDAGSSTAHVVLTFRTPTRATTTQSGKKLLVFATGPQLTNGRRNLDDSEEIDTLAKTAALEGGPGDPRILPTNSESLDTNKFYGRPISIEVRDMGVGDVVQLVAEQSGANIVLAGDIQGKISLKLKQIPWDQALTIVMKSQNLGYVRQGSVLRIAGLDKIKAENDATKAIIDAQVAAEPLKVKIVPVSYAVVADLVARVSPFLTKSRGAVVADTRTSSLIITDTPAIIDRVTNLIKALDTPPLQVIIESKVVEASENFSRNYGVSWGITGQQISSANIQRNNLSISPTGGTPGGALAYNIRLGTFDILGDLDAALGLAENQNTAKILSAPRLTTMNNEEATLTQGSTIFIPQTTVGSAGATTGFTAVPVNLTLKVTPQVTTEGDILMKLSVQRDFVSSVSTGASSSSSGSSGGSSGGSSSQAPIETRKVDTKIMVRNGQTAVVGGVYQSDTLEGESGVPVLKDIPVLGYLFKQKQTTKAKNELLVFLTPRIINTENATQAEGTF